MSNQDQNDNNNTGNNSNNPYEGMELFEENIIEFGKESNKRTRDEEDYDENEEP